MKTSKNPWFETLTHRLELVQQIIPAKTVRYFVVFVGLISTALAFEYIQEFWTLWETAPRAGVVAIALASALNGVLLILFIVSIGQINLKPTLAQIHRLGILNLLLELAGFVIGEILIAQEEEGSLMAIEFWLVQFCNLGVTLAGLWYVHLLNLLKLPDGQSRNV